MHTGRRFQTRTKDGEFERVMRGKGWDYLTSRTRRG